MSLLAPQAWVAFFNATPGGTIVVPTLARDVVQAVINLALASEALEGLGGRVYRNGRKKLRPGEAGWPFAVVLGVNATTRRLMGRDDVFRTHEVQFSVFAPGSDRAVELSRAVEATFRPPGGWEADPRPPLAWEGGAEWHCETTRGPLLREPAAVVALVDGESAPRAVHGWQVPITLRIDSTEQDL